MIYACTNGDATLFSHGDLVEAAWKIAQPILHYWKENVAPEFPNYTRGSWGPKEASELLDRDGRHWYEAATTEILERLPLFKDSDELLLNALTMALRPVTAAAAAGTIIIHKGAVSKEMYLICHGEVEVIDENGQIIESLHDGNIFSEVSLLISTTRTASVRAKTLTDLFVLGESGFLSDIARSPPICRDNDESGQREIQRHDIQRTTNDSRSTLFLNFVGFYTANET